MRWKKHIFSRSFNSRRQPTLGKLERTDSRSQGLRLGRSYQSSVSLLSWEERAFRQFLLPVRFLTVNPTTGDAGGRNRPFPGRLGAGDRPPTGVSHRFETSKATGQRVSNCNSHRTLLRCWRSGLGAESVHFWRAPRSHRCCWFSDHTLSSQARLTWHIASQSFTLRKHGSNAIRGQEVFI